MTSADRIRLRRIELGMTQSELAKKLGLTVSAVTKTESRGDLLTRTTLSKYAQALDCSVDYLVSDGTNYINIDTDKLAYITARPHLLSYAMLLGKLSEEHQHSIVDQIEYLIDKEKKD